MNNKAWGTFTKRIPIDATKEEIYRAIGTQNGYENWFLRKAEFSDVDGNLRERDEFIQIADSFLWLWHGHDDSVREERKVIEADDSKKVEFHFTANCRVAISILESAEGNIVELVQRDIEYDDNPSRNLVVACGEGWTFYLANLKSYLEGGIDLRNKNARIKGVINA